MKRRFFGILLVCLLFATWTAQGEAEGISHMVRLSDIALQIAGEDALELSGLSLTFNRLNGSAYLRVDAGEVFLALGGALVDDQWIVFMDSLEGMYAFPARIAVISSAEKIVQGEFVLPDGRVGIFEITSDARGSRMITAEAENLYLEASDTQAGGAYTLELTAAMDDMRLRIAGVRTDETSQWRAHFEGSDETASFFITMAYEAEIVLQDGAQTEVGVFALSAGEVSLSANVEVIRREANASVSFVDEASNIVFVEEMMDAEIAALAARVRAKAMQFASGTLSEVPSLADFVMTLVSPEELSKEDVSSLLEEAFVKNVP